MGQTLPKIAALIVAAGQGARAGGGVPKQYRPLAGRPLLSHALEALAGHDAIALVQCVIGVDQDEQFAAARAGVHFGAAKIMAAVPGGQTRQQSVRAGLEALTANAPDLVLIHDAARPFLSAAVIDRLVDALKHHAGALPALAVVDSLRIGADGEVTGDVPRDGLYRAQTPQAFRFDAILAAHRQYAEANETDDVALARRAGHAVAIVEGEEALFKVTQAADFARAEAHLENRLGDVRVGQGFDVHAFAPGDHVWLCGVKIPHDRSLAGHSDADAGLHAITDAILGALGAGDIGDHFPPSDPQWRGASSDIFLRHAGGLVTKAGGMIAHIDVTLICERPKIGPHRAAMIAQVAEILGLPPGRVAVKATTTEQLGFTGRGEGLAAQAVATIRLPLEGNSA
ncbi:MAG: bifunctional 2-C-methyl-D-erythritol 4-phosphate cytidylyltransferase/2-C-methyl-D-erythritol 2,4-cyclodiphosphate synthase [Sphingomonadales bacterium]